MKVRRLLVIFASPCRFWCSAIGRKVWRVTYNLCRPTYLEGKQSKVKVTIQIITERWCTISCYVCVCVCVLAFVRPSAAPALCERHDSIAGHQFSWWSCHVHSSWPADDLWPGGATPPRPQAQYVCGCFISQWLQL